MSLSSLGVQVYWAWPGENISKKKRTIYDGQFIIQE